MQGQRRKYCFEMISLCYDWRLKTVRTDFPMIGNIHTVAYHSLHCNFSASGNPRVLDIMEPAGGIEPAAFRKSSRPRRLRC